MPMGRQMSASTQTRQVDDAGQVRRRLVDEQVGVEVAGQQRRLEEEHRHRPHRRRAAEHRQHHLGEHRLDGEQQERGEEGGDGERPHHRRRVLGELDQERRHRAERTGVGGLVHRYVLVRHPRAPSLCNCLSLAARAIARGRRRRSSFKPSAPGQPSAPRRSFRPSRPRTCRHRGPACRERSRSGTAGPARRQRTSCTRRRRTSRPS